MKKYLRKIMDNLFAAKSEKEKNYIPLYNHLNQARYTEKEVDVVKDNYSFLKMNKDNYYIYKHDFTKEFIEITPLGNICSGRIDSYNYVLNEIDKIAW